MTNSTMKYYSSLTTVSTPCGSVHRSLEHVLLSPGGFQTEKDPSISLYSSIVFSSVIFFLKKFSVYPPYSCLLRMK